MMTLDGTDDVFDSRDVIERIAELEATAFADRTEDEKGELLELENFAREASDYCPDWQYGERFIRDSYFEDYAREFAEDIGAIKSDASWPLYAIDWERAARDLQIDYTSFELYGVMYWGLS